MRDEGFVQFVRFVFVLNPVFRFEHPLLGRGLGRSYIQLVTPRVVAMAVRMLMTIWTMNLMVSFFIVI